MKKVLVIILVFSCVSSFSQNKIELLNKGNEYHAIKRRSSSFNTSRIAHLYQDPQD